MDSEDPCLINCELFGKHAAFFESTIVPRWGESYDSLVARSGVEKGSMALDVGAGGGEVALRLSPAVGPEGKVVALDSQPEMLEIARRKAKDRGIHNIEFKEASMESMGLPDDSFDFAVGHYSLCCCTDYAAALSECLRVLKRGGRLTYNHEGPHRALSLQTVFSIFEGYKTKSPSEKLKETRRSEAVQVDGVKKYEDPFFTLGTMRKLGFDNAEATLAKGVIHYRDAEACIDEYLQFDWAPEVEEIPPAELQRFKEQAVRAITPLSKGPGFDVERDVVFFTGTKP